MLSARGGPRRHLRCGEPSPPALWAAAAATRVRTISTAICSTPTSAGRTLAQKTPTASLRYGVPATARKTPYEHTSSRQSSQDPYSAHGHGSGTYGDEIALVPRDYHTTSCSAGRLMRGVGRTAAMATSSCPAYLLLISLQPSTTSPLDLSLLTLSPHHPATRPRVDAPTDSTLSDLYATLPPLSAEDARRRRQSLQYDLVGTRIKQLC